MDDRKLGGVSRGELERRWVLVRAHMQDRQLDAIVAQTTDSTNNPGNTRWLTDAVTAYRHVVVFFADGTMSVIEHGPQGGHRNLQGRDPTRPGVAELFTVAQFPAIAYTQGYEARIVTELLTGRGCTRVGLVAPGIMPHILVRSIEEILENRAEISDETEFFDRCKAIKSPEEQAMLRQAIALHDGVFDKLLHKIRPGMRDLEVASIIHYEGRLLGSTHGTIMAGSAAPGEPAPIMPPHLQGRVIRQGDYLSVLLENAGPGGWFGELARPISFGRASNELLEATAAIREAQDHTRNLLVTGASCEQIFAAHNTYMQAHAMPPEQRIYAHGQGYDIVERPLIRSDEPMTVQPDMFFAVHPLQATPTLQVFLCDNCFVPETGAPTWEHRTERRVFEV